MIFKTEYNGTEVNVDASGPIIKIDMSSSYGLINAYTAHFSVNLFEQSSCAAMVDQEAEERGKARPAYIETFTISEQHRNKSHGSFLLNTMLKFLTEFMFCDIIGLAANPHDECRFEDLIRFYNKNGFEQTSSTSPAIMIYEV